MVFILPSNVVDRFLKYVTIHTTSKEDEDSIPSTKRQFDLAKILVQELKGLGVVDALVTDNCYVIATLPSNQSDELTKNIQTKQVKQCNGRKKRQT